LCLFQKGLSKISSALTISANNISIKGDGISSILRHSNSNSETFRIVADVDFWSVSSIKINHSIAATSGFVFQI
jgi:hypothetical protein